MSFPIVIFVCLSGVSFAAPLLRRLDETGTAPLSRDSNAISDLSPEEQDMTSHAFLTPVIAGLILAASFVLFAVATTILIVVGRKRYGQQEQARNDDDDVEKPRSTLTETATRTTSTTKQNEHRSDTSSASRSNDLAFPLPQSISREQQHAMPVHEVGYCDDQSDVSSVSTSLSNSLRLLRDFEEDELLKKTSLSSPPQSPVRRAAQSLTVGAGGGVEV